MAKSSSKKKTRASQVNASTADKSNCGDMMKDEMNKCQFFPSNLLLPLHQHKNHNPNSYTMERETPTPQEIYPRSVFVVSNFLSSQECQSILDHANQSQELTWEPISQPQTKLYAHRSCERLQCHDWNFSRLIFERMTSLKLWDWLQGKQLPISPQIYVSTNTNNASRRNSTNRQQTNVLPYDPVGCNGNIRMYRYHQGQGFGKHYDGSDDIQQFNHGHTEMTVLIYLTSCIGGATRFYPPNRLPSSNHQGSSTISKKKKKRKKQELADSNVDETNDDNAGVDRDKEIAFVPRAGTMLLHVHGDRCLAHEADPVEKGVKVVLRTDVVFGTSE